MRCRHVAPQDSWLRSHADLNKGYCGCLTPETAGMAAAQDDKGSAANSLRKLKVTFVPWRTWWGHCSGIRPYRTSTQAVSESPCLPRDRTGAGFAESGKGEYWSAEWSGIVCLSVAVYLCAQVVTSSSSQASLISLKLISAAPSRSVAFVLLPLGRRGRDSLFPVIIPAAPLSIYVSRCVRNLADVIASG